jgi:hypothetical protein
MDCRVKPGNDENKDSVMAKKNQHIGSSFESWLDEEGIREEVAAAAIKEVIARQLASERRKKRSPNPSAHSGGN